MKKIFIITGFFALSAGMISCGGARGNDPGESYMPDMYYSRAYETYGYNNVEGERDSLARRNIRYTGMPVPGTIARNEMLPYHIELKDTAAFDAVRSPLDTVTATAEQMREAERLYLINCGICHGDALDGNGPLYNEGNGPYAAAPANFKNPAIMAQTDGHYFHVITYGIRAMGSYGQQLSPEQRWWVIKYIRSKQNSGGTAEKASAGSSNQEAAPNTSAGGEQIVPSNQNQN